jgi:hypothetical protein
MALGLGLQAAPALALSNASIVAKAQSYPNGYLGGQCIVWVGRVLSQASGGKIRISAYASGYQGTYPANGAKQVSKSSATGGDVIQVTPAGTPDSWKGPEGNRPLHTAIILKNLGNGNFSVIDSNAKYNERVSRHNYSPYATGRTVKIWRFGSVASKAPPGPVPSGGDSVGMYFPWDHTMHLRNSLSSGPSDYAFSYGTSSGGVEGTPLTGNWDGQ